MCVVAALLVGLALVPPIYASVTGNSFLMSLCTRIIILAMAAMSLNLILGYGGMVSFGHAVYLGIGGYAVGILAKEGVLSGFLQWPVALAASALFALAVGALSLRTRGVYFIMITLAFAQMLYYFGDRARPLWRRRRNEHLQAQRFCRVARSLQPDAVLLSLLYAAIADHLPDLAAREFAFRDGHPRLPLERAPHASNRVSDLSL